MPRIQATNTVTVEVTLFRFDVADIVKFSGNYEIVTI